MPPYERRTSSIFFVNGEVGLEQNVSSIEHDVGFSEHAHSRIKGTFMLPTDV